LIRENEPLYPLFFEANLTQNSPGIPHSILGARTAYQVVAFSFRTSKKGHTVGSIFQGLQEKRNFQFTRTWQGNLPDSRPCWILQVSQDPHHPVGLMLAVKYG
jgi:hypothetical protein